MKIILTLLLLASSLGIYAQCDTKCCGAVKLTDYKPVSIYNIPVTPIEKAKFPVIDMHSHVYPTTLQELDEWVATKNV